MTRFNTARVLAGVGALGFFLAAALHTSAYRQVVLQAQQGFAGTASVVAALWLAFGGALLLFGTMVALVGFGQVTGARWILALAACFPLITVVLQLRFLGFIPPVVILSTVALVTSAAAVVWPGVKQRVDVAAA